MRKADIFLKENYIQSFRNTFNSAEGRQTLDIILQLSGIWNTESTGPKDEGRKEIGAEIIQMLGVEDKGRSGAVMSAMTDGIMNSLGNIPITIKKKEEDKKR